MRHPSSEIKQLTLYHGSPDRADKCAFGREGNEIPIITPGRPFFVTDDYHYAEFFARGGVVCELEVNLGRVLDLRDADEQLRVLQLFNEDAVILNSRGAWDEDVDGDISDSSYFLLESPAVMNAILAEGFSAVLLPEDFERGVESYALLSTEMIKLRHVRELNAAPAQSGFQPFRMG